ncbi:MAG: uracil-DNA glycosylase [Rhizomicrobium sp.]|nr:uracil-DNA glycosylase [Rhizomicrobium sp.]
MSVPMTPLDTLAWLLESGADESIGDTPIDRFTVRPAPPPAIAAATPAAAPVYRAPAASALKSASPLPTQADSDTIASAQALAAAATTLAELKAALEGFEGSALKQNCTSTVFADGNPASRILFIGEAPGAEEDRQGLPFVGRAGKLLDRMMAAINLDRSSAYITNVLNWRPPANRDPSPEEAAICLPFLRRHIELTNPGIIILLGAVAARHVLGYTEGIMKLRGRWLEYRVGDVMVPVMATLHPAYLLRQPAHKKLAWRDLQAAEQKMITLGLLEKHGSIG